MTGAYVRVNREGVWVNVEIEHLTVKERHDALKAHSADDVLKWLDLVCKELAKTETLLESLVEEGILSKEANH